MNALCAFCTKQKMNYVQDLYMIIFGIYLTFIHDCAIIRTEQRDSIPHLERRKFMNIFIFNKDRVIDMPATMGDSFINAAGIYESLKVLR